MSTDTIDAPALGLDDSFARAFPQLVVSATPAGAPDPELVVLNEPLAVELGLDVEWLRSGDGVRLLAGDGALAEPEPVAMGYAGHQFGGYSPRLGDGRALLLGELVTPDGERVDLHLKGSGRTPFARGGDGKATLGPMLREYVFAAAMSALGVPTTRALAVTTTGEMVARERMLPGAVLTRVAASHLRVGTFEYVARMDSVELLDELVAYAIDRHHPELAEVDDPALALFVAVRDAQASLVARWMSIGFIHGVMNTDNVTISGETIDYGPCAFMDRYDPATVFSSIDHGGRYAFGNQPSITGWNLARFAETLIPAVNGDTDDAVATLTTALDGFGEQIRGEWLDLMRAKLGLGDPRDGDGELVDAYLELLHAQGVDHTNSFLALAASLRGDTAAIAEQFGTADEVDRWIERWHRRVRGDGADDEVLADAMDAVNPRYIPRNHLVDAALRASEEGDLAPFSELLAVVETPFDSEPGRARFAEPAPDEFNRGFRTFCGT